MKFSIALPAPTGVTLLVLVLLISTGCSAIPGLSPTPTPVPPTSTFTPVPTGTAVPTDTPLPTNTPTLIPPTEAPTATSTPTDTPTATFTPEPSPTNTSTPTETPTVTSAPAAQMLPGNAIMIYFILPDTGGPVACGDNLIGVYSGLVATGDVKTDVTAAFNRLFSIGVKEYKGLYNALYQSKLSVSKIDYNKSAKDITIYSPKGYVKPKTDCDHLRYRAQVWATITQFEGVKRAHVYVGGQKLGDLLAANDK